MGAAASSEASLKRTLVAALGPGRAGTGRLPQNPSVWTVQQVGIWLQEIEMASLAKTMADNNIDGSMLLEDSNQEDIVALVLFPPLRRKLVRSIESLRRFAIPAADMTEVSQDIQASLDQLNNTMRELAASIALESTTASGNPPPLPSGDATKQGRDRRDCETEDEGQKGGKDATDKTRGTSVWPHAFQDGVAAGDGAMGEAERRQEGMSQEAAAVAIQKRTRDMAVRKKGHATSTAEHRTPEKVEGGGEGKEMGGEGDEGGQLQAVEAEDEEKTCAQADATEDAAATKIQAHARGRAVRKSRISFQAGVPGMETVEEGGQT